MLRYSYLHIKRKLECFRDTERVPSSSECGTQDSQGQMLASAFSLQPLRSFEPFALLARKRLRDTGHVPLTLLYSQHQTAPLLLVYFSGIVTSPAEGERKGLVNRAAEGTDGAHESGPTR